METDKFTHSAATVRPWRALAGLLAAGITLSASAGDLTWKKIQFGGFVSQGFLVNTGNNDYLGDTSEGTFDFREAAFNASWATGKFRIGAQAFTQKLGEYGDDHVSLDWAIVDYQAAQWLGFRAGRVKMSRGLYNEALDVDSVRPFVLLPQSAYDARLRGFNAAFNGAMAHGNIGLGRYGSADYRLFYGDIPMSTTSGANDYFNNDMPYPNASIGMDAVFGGTLFWNTPVTGLKTGYSFSGFKDFGADRKVVFVMPDTPPIEMILYRVADLYQRHMFSVEYSHGDWVFATEAGTDRARYGIGSPGGAPAMYQYFSTLYGYASVSRRIHPRVELGAYYSFSREEQKETAGGLGLTYPDFKQHDFALSSKFDVTDRLIVKLEGHYLDGAGKIFDTPAKPQPLAQRDTSWFMLAAKATYSF